MGTRAAERLADFQQKTKDDPILQQLKETIELGCSPPNFSKIAKTQASKTR